MMVQREIEICKERINELMFAKITLLQIIADSDDTTPSSDSMSVDLIEWKITNINKTILNIQRYIDILSNAS